MGPALKINTRKSTFSSISPASATSNLRFEDILENDQAFEEVRSSHEFNTNGSSSSGKRVRESVGGLSGRGESLTSSSPLLGGEIVDSPLSGVNRRERFDLDELEESTTNTNASPSTSNYRCQRGHTSRTSSVSLSSTGPTLSRRNISSLATSGMQSPLLSSTSNKDRHDIFKSTSQKIGFAKKIWYRYKLLGRSSSRLIRLLVLVVLLYFIWYMMQSRESTELKRVRLRTKWWENDADPVTLYPRPAMPPAFIDTTTIISTSHTLNELSKLSSAFTPSAPFEYTAFLHVHTSLHLTTLPFILESIQSQSIIPQSIIIHSPHHFDPSSVVSTISSTIAISFSYYANNQSPSLSIIETISSITTPYLLLFMSTNTATIGHSYAENLLRVAGTREYSNTFLSRGGLYYSSNHDSKFTAQSQVDCYPDQSAQYSSQEIIIPTDPFLIETSAFHQITNGLRTDLEPLVAITLALSNQKGMIGFRIPSKGDTRQLWGEEEKKRCEELLDNLGGDSTLNFFKSHVRNRNIRSKSWYSDEKVVSIDQGEEDGSIVLLLSGEEELRLSHSLACKISQRHDIRVYVTDLDLHKYTSNSRVFFSSSFNSTNFEEAQPDSMRCHLDINIIGSASTLSTSYNYFPLSLMIIEELIKLQKIEVLIYLENGRRGREFSDVGRSLSGNKRAGSKLEEDKAVIIELKKEEVGMVDWLSTLPIEAIRHWHTPRIDISVITNNRPSSLSRLLNALQSAHYFNDEVSLTINLEQTTDRITQKLVHSLQWNHGKVNLRHRIVMGGLMQAITESWYPTNSDTYGVLLEDDVEVSPLFYSWLKFTILHYRYVNINKAQAKRLFGISLYQQKNIELRPAGRLPFDAHTLFQELSLHPTSPYLSQVPCSWGSVYFPEIWIEFHAYLSLRLSETTLSISDFIVPSIRSNKWPRSWKKYFIELVFLRGYVMLYPNYENFESFSTNHLEKGTHIHVKEMDEKRKSQFEVPLMGILPTSRNIILSGLPNQRLPPWQELPVVDLWGNISTGMELIERGWQSITMLSSCPIIDLRKNLTFDARELLCKKVYDPSVGGDESSRRIFSSEQEEGVVRRPLEERISTSSTSSLNLASIPPISTLILSPVATVSLPLGKFVSIPTQSSTSIILGFVEEPLQIIEPFLTIHKEMLPGRLEEEEVVIDAEKIKLPIPVEVIGDDDEEWDDDDDDEGGLDNLNESVLEEVATIEDIPSGKERYEIESDAEK